MDTPSDAPTAQSLAKLIEDFAAGRLSAASWERFFVNHYRGDLLEAARSEVVRIRITSGDELAPNAVAKLTAIAARLRHMLTCDAADVPAAWKEFLCADYFNSGYAKTGWWDEAGQCWYILPADRVHVDRSRSLLVIGGPAVDGIPWGYRLGHAGIWAHYPIGNEFCVLAPTVAALHEGYASGSITV